MTPFDAIMIHPSSLPRQNLKHPRLGKGDANKCKLCCNEYTLEEMNTVFKLYKARVPPSVHVTEVHF